jgi:hypothetical protein
MTALTSTQVDNLQKVRCFDRHNHMKIPRSHSECVDIGNIRFSNILHRLNMSRETGYSTISLVSGTRSYSTHLDQRSHGLQRPLGRYSIPCSGFPMSYPSDLGHFFGSVFQPGELAHVIPRNHVTADFSSTFSGMSMGHLIS